MSDVSLNEVALDLLGLIAGLGAGEEVSLVQNGKRVATIRKEPIRDFACKAGSAKGKILHMADDFDAPLDDFREYMQ